MFISIETVLNMGRLILNLRLNRYKNNSRFLSAVSKVSGQGFSITSRFLIHVKRRFFSDKDEKVNVIKLDDIQINDENGSRGLKLIQKGEIITHFQC